MNKIEVFFNNIIQNYNEKKYWKARFNLYKKKNKLMKYYYLFMVKRMDAKNNASLGANINGGSKFCDIPFLPHGIKGIFIAPTSSIGKKCTIFQQVTIGIKDMDNLQGPIIGNNVVIGAGAKIIGPIRIGNNVTIGAGAIVVSDIPDNCVVVSPKATIIKQK